MIEQGVFAHLCADPVVAALVGTRIYPLVIPQRVGGEPAVMPCVVHQRVDVRRQVKFCGTDDLVRSVVQLDCYATSLAAAATLAAATRGALVDFQGMMGADVVKATHLDYESQIASPDPGLHRVMQRFILWHEETP